MKLLVLLIMFVMPSLLSAAEQEEPTVYVIKQGDTLWGLSERFIKDPNYWPNMWSKNSQITNPHFIYPGQKVRIFPDRLEFIPKEPAAAVKAQKVAAADSVAETVQEVASEKSYTVYGSEGFIAEDDFKPYGLLLAAQHNRVIVGVDDIVYTDIGTDNGSASGDKFSIFFKDALVRHPVTNEKLGNKIIPLGTLQLTDVEQKSSRAIVTRGTREISPGAYLLPYRESRRREISLKNSNAELKGVIVESRSGIGIIAAGDIVYIDLGSNHGAEAGNMLYIVRDVTIDKSYVKGEIGALPQELLGALVILEAGKNTSTALVVKSIDTIYKGDSIVSQTK
ncbi:MAG: LysM peptidoglycan-binding domain-containing protein [Desulfuromonadaceae bacterium]|nr:LysM peptidoglycan-binding domain-containing protein [Desulfuromonadaceae bacterium]MDD2853944.1 LysM peptidoglycan-binding domain-containing protein [Desulfuromonadaceae bacterium]